MEVTVPSTADSQSVLSVRDLHLGFHTERGFLEAVSGVSFNLRKGETLGLVGESGCGKSVTAMAILRLLPQPAGKITQGSICFDGSDLTLIDPQLIRSIRGRRIAMIFQEPMTALNPVHSIGKQMAEVFQLHRPEMTREQITQACIDLLDQVGIPAPAQRLVSYPHQLSGGMRQRVMIAMALACEPDILIADEPTTALDVTIQAQILELIAELQKKRSMAVLLITHDLGVVANYCDRVLVMYAGHSIEEASVAEFFRQPLHPYSRALLASIPRWDTPRKQILQTIRGTVPALDQYPQGCRFQNRCDDATDLCRETLPTSEVAHARNRHSDKTSEHMVRCHHYQRYLESSS